MIGPREAHKRYRLRGRAAPVAPTWPHPGQSRGTYNPAPLLSRWPRDLTRKSPMPKHLTLAELTAGLPGILASPADNGTLRAIVIRPEHGAPLRGHRRGMRRLQPLHQRLPGSRPASPWNSWPRARSTRGRARRCARGIEIGRRIRTIRCARRSSRGRLARLTGF